MGWARVWIQALNDLPGTAMWEEKVVRDGEIKMDIQIDKTNCRSECNSEKNPVLIKHFYKR